MVVTAIFITMFFIWGAVNSTAVFFVPVLKAFGWTRTKFSVTFSIGWVTGGAAGPLIGWLADRMSPKRMMIAGATITGLLWIALSRATAFGQFLTINGISGISIGAATVIPSSLIIARWFQRQRGLALGIATAGIMLGGAVMTPFANHVIATAGWRAGYFSLSLPILLFAVPSIMFLVRLPSPVERGAKSLPSGEMIPSASLAGFDLKDAAKTQSFWFICIVQLLIGSTLGMGPHYVAYLTGVGYNAGFAATVVSMYLIMTTFGALLGGRLADLTSARAALISTSILASFGALNMMAVAHPLALAVHILASGFAGGAIGVQIPLVTIESLGLKRLGSLMGVTGIFYTMGAAISPIATGRIFDLTGSYQMAIAAIAVMLILATAALFGCRPLAAEQARLQARVASAAA